MKAEVIKQLSILITGAFGLVAALAWNTAIQTIFKNYFGEHNSVPAMILYAVIVTIIAVIATIWIGKLSQRYVPKPVEQQPQKQKKR